MKIRRSTEQDFDRIMEIYRIARQFMAENGNPRQWGLTGWPPEDLIHADIRGWRSKKSIRCFVPVSIDTNTNPGACFLNSARVCLLSWTEPSHGCVEDGHATNE